MAVRSTPGLSGLAFTGDEGSARSGSGHFRCRPDRDLPERDAARSPHAGDHLAPAPLHLLARSAAVLHDALGVAVAPRLPDARERFPRYAQGVDDHVVDADVPQPEVGEVRERLAADVQIAADRGAVAVGNALPEAVGIEFRGMAPEHAVILGDEVQAAAGL